MFVLLLTWLQTRNSFRHIRLKSKGNRHLEPEQQVSLGKDMSFHLSNNMGTPLSFDKHVHFTNFSAMGLEMPIYFNVVREPIDKLMSRFYYARVTPRPGAFTPRGATPTPRSTPSYATIEQCLSSGGADCTFIPGERYDLTVAYFCGHEPYCRVLQSKAALEQAKRNIERHYPVVGVLEQLNVTLAVLEKTLPAFFAGVNEIYFQQLAAPHMNKNNQRPPIALSATSEAVLRRNLSVEIELYHFIRDRLYRQYKRID